MPVNVNLWYSPKFPVSGDDTMSYRPYCITDHKGDAIIQNASPVYVDDSPEAMRDALVLCYSATSAGSGEEQFIYNSYEIYMQSFLGDSVPRKIAEELNLLKMDIHFEGPTDTHIDVPPCVADGDDYYLMHAPIYISNVNMTETVTASRMTRSVGDFNSCAQFNGKIYFASLNVIKETNQWMPAMTHMYQHYVDDRFWYVEGKLQALQRLRAGVTCGVCVLGSQPRCDTPAPALNNARGYAEVGVRDIVCAGPQHTPWPHNFSDWKDGVRVRKQVSFEQVCDSLEEVISTLHNTNEGKTLAYVAPFGLITSINPSGATPESELTLLTEHDVRQARAMRRIADKYRTRIHTDCFGGMIRLAMQQPDDMLLAPDVHVQHCTALYDDEIEAQAKSGASASVAPYWSDAPVEKMLRAGINVVIGTDGPGDNCDLDLLTAARMFALNYRRDVGNRRFLPYEKLLEMITIDAAKAVGLSDTLGSLEAGKQADVITIDLRTPRLMPLYNVVHALILSGTGSDVDNVIVNGEVLLR
ncbi:MAG: hypothetical protein EOM63_07530, partial [Clostridia bacterium]|nr:hypothetical protein [Clostridia bacterium]